MTDNEIIKHLKKILERMLYEGDLQNASIIGHALDLINHYEAKNKILNMNVKELIDSRDKVFHEAQAEIKKYKAEIERLQKAYLMYEETSGLKKAKAEAINEFASRLASHYPNSYSILKRIDTVLQEMVGEEKC